MVMYMRAKEKGIARSSEVKMAARIDASGRVFQLGSSGRYIIRYDTHGLLAAVHQATFQEGTWQRHQLISWRKGEVLPLHMDLIDENPEIRKYNEWFPVFFSK